MDRHSVQENPHRIRTGNVNGKRTVFHVASNDIISGLDDAQFVIGVIVCRTTVQRFHIIRKRNQRGRSGNSIPIYVQFFFGELLHFIRVLSFFIRKGFFVHRNSNAIKCQKKDERNNCGNCANELHAVSAGIYFCHRHSPPYR